MIYPRPYQIEAVQSVFDYFIDGKSGNPLIAMPTGTGKSIIPPLFMYQAMRQWPNQRFLLLTHVKELIEQNAKKMLEVWPTAPFGIYSAGLDRKEAYPPIVFGGIASVVNSIQSIGWRDIMFIDEAHLLNPNEESMYQTVIKELREINPAMKIIGLTATPFRMGQGYLTQGNIFTDIAFDITGLEAFNRLIDEYYLAHLVPKPTHNQIDVSDVRIMANDYNQKQLAQAVDQSRVVKNAIEEAIALAHDRKKWMVFGSGIENCHHLSEYLNYCGVSATVVHSKLEDEQRDERIKAFKEGRFRAIVSNNILTTGFDDPGIDCIVDLRPTTSVVLHIQKYGRGTRPFYHPSFSQESLRTIEGRKLACEAGGKRNCLVLDFANNVSRLGPINDPRIPKKKGESTGEIPVKICPACDAYNHTIARICVNCGHEFVFKTKIKPKASELDIIARIEPNIEILNVDMVTRAIHKKVGKPDSLKISYFCGYRMFNHWLVFEILPGKSAFPKKKALDWWRQHFGEDLPSNAQEAYDKFPACNTAKQIRVNTAKEHPEILEFIF